MNFLLPHILLCVYIYFFFFCVCVYDVKEAIFVTVLRVLQHPFIFLSQEQEPWHPKFHTWLVLCII